MISSQVKKIGVVMPTSKRNSSGSNAPTQPDEAKTKPADLRQQQEQQARQSAEDQRTGKQKLMERSMRKADVAGK
jgi:hypothetical protein